MITLKALTKRYGANTAVDDLSLQTRPGVVTGFLGPNGAGKSTTMRLILGLDRPTSGEALIGGRPYAALRYPLREVGARSFHPWRDLPVTAAQSAPRAVGAARLQGQSFRICCTSLRDVSGHLDPPDGRGGADDHPAGCRTRAAWPWSASCRSHGAALLVRPGLVDAKRHTRAA